MGADCPPPVQYGRAFHARVIDDMSWPVILFYKYVADRGAGGFRGGAASALQSLGLKGRVLIAAEGINGTLAGPVAAINEYVAALHRDPRFADVEMKVSAGDADTFPKLVVKVRREIVTLGPAGTRAESRAPALARGMEADDGRRSRRGPARCPQSL